MEQGIYHRGVLVDESVRLLVGNEKGFYVDATIGGGDHAEKLLRFFKGARVLGLDRDKEAIEFASKRLRRFSRLTIVKAEFSHLPQIIKEYSFDDPDGVLFDLGTSRHQLDIAGRGFSFDREGPLDMRADRENKLTAERVLNYYEEEALYRIFKEYGEFEKPGRLARMIVEARPLKTTKDLRAIVEKIVPHKSLIAALSKVFQAIRIEVNDEMTQLTTSLESTLEILKPGGRIAVISYHSLEDRIVKQFFRQESSGCICPPELPVCRCGHIARLSLITPKPVRPTEEEILSNPSSRSALLRVAQKVA